MNEAGKNAKIQSDAGLAPAQSVTLPRHVEPVPVAEVSRAVAATGTAARVLLVEDNKDVRKLFTIVLNRSGFQVDAMWDGHEAAALIDTAPAPDVILIDRMLPGLPGDILLERIRASARWHSVPVVVVSALRRRFDIKQLLAAGANAYLAKPVDTRELVRTLRDEIARATASSPLAPIDKAAKLPTRA
ncbi:MAG: response regulator transcription factor [Burkholderiaceae bacterium]